MKQLRTSIPKSWILEVEETKKHGILVFTDMEKNQKIYVKLCSPEHILAYGIVFEFVDPSELTTLGISETVIEESYNMQLKRQTEIKEKYFEESEKTVEHTEDFWQSEEGKKLRAEAEKKLAQEKINNAKNLTINIMPKAEETSEDTEPFVLEKKQIEIWKKFGDPRVFDMENKEALADFVTGLINEALDAKKATHYEAPSGVAPLNNAQIGKSPQVYDSQDKMIADLVKKADSGDIASREILNILNRKMHSGFKQQKNSATEIELPSISDLVKHKRRRKLENNEPDVYEEERKR